jgi:hypothetical protein
MQQLLDSVTQLFFDEALSRADYSRISCDKLGAIFPWESQLAQSVEAFAFLAEADRDAIRSRVTEDMEYALLTFAMRMASETVNLGVTDLTSAAAMAFALANAAADPRDIYVTLAIVHDAGLRKGAPVGDLLRGAARVAASRMSYFIVDGFLTGPAYMKSIDSMGVRLVAVGGRLTYRLEMS